MGHDRLMELAARAGTPVRRVAGLDLIAAERSLAVLDEIGRAGVRLLGAEGFTLEGGTVRPDPGCILDLSSMSDPAEAVAEARAFVTGLSQPGIWLELVLDD